MSFGEYYNASLNLRDEEITEAGLIDEQIKLYKTDIRIKSVENQLQNTQVMDPQYDWIEAQLDGLIQKRRCHVERIAGIRFLLVRKNAPANATNTDRSK